MQRSGWKYNRLLSRSLSTIGSYIGDTCSALAWSRAEDTGRTYQFLCRYLGTQNPSAGPPARPIGCSGSLPKPRTPSSLLKACQKNDNPTQHCFPVVFPERRRPDACGFPDPSLSSKCLKHSSPPGPANPTSSAARNDIRVARRHGTRRTFIELSIKQGPILA
ncbi:hypothetical protein FA95DRAFT_1424400 [Auriscalpium vulgare]|uniref:Uncharacterized protein n=1 Tax=Auriscalpium vulgare TaxID=40419 RepID=A0ACB8RQ12_9AGAM|nr:hypothetical protein FA95DRAFT_1424400 [Auriscalpium vulgare]